MKGGKRKLADEIETLFNEIYDRTHQKILIYITGKCHKVEDIDRGRRADA